MEECSEAVNTAVRGAWDLPTSRLWLLPDGATCRSWSVDTGSHRFVARWVPEDRRGQLMAGLAAAEQLDRHGVRSARPVRAADGGLVASISGRSGATGALALIEQLPGRPLVGSDPVDQQWWGERLGTFHRTLAGFAHRGLPPWYRLRPEAAHLGLEPWLRPAITAAIAEVTRLTVTDLITYGVLHGDPAPEAFWIDQATGVTGVTDRATARVGPLMYDVATAVMYAGGPGAAAELIDGYAAAGPVPRDEIEATLPILLRFRWAVEADQLARVSAARRSAGAGSATAWLATAGPAPDLRRGLDDARMALVEG